MLKAISCESNSLAVLHPHPSQGWAPLPRYKSHGAPHPQHLPEAPRQLRSGRLEIEFQFEESLSVFLQSKMSDKKSFSLSRTPGAKMGFDILPLHSSPEQNQMLTKL